LNSNKALITLSENKGLSILEDDDMTELRNCIIAELRIYMGKTYNYFVFQPKYRIFASKDKYKSILKEKGFTKTLQFPNIRIWLRS
jgi:hypothetical protein